MVIIDPMTHVRITIRGMDASKRGRNCGKSRVAAIILEALREHKKLAISYTTKSTDLFEKKVERIYVVGDLNG